MKKIAVWKDNSKRELAESDIAALAPELNGATFGATPKLTALASSGYTAIQFNSAPKQSIFDVIAKAQKVAQAFDAEHVISNLVMIVANDGDIYRQRIQPIIKNLQGKVSKGVFDPSLAAKAFAYAAEDALNKNAKDIVPGGIPRGLKNKVLMDAGAQLAEYYKEDYMPDAPSAR